MVKGATALCEITCGGMSPGVFLRALRPELGSAIVGRGVTAGTADDGIWLQIRSEDVPGLRAALNSYLHWIQTISQVGQKVTVVEKPATKG